MLWSIHRRQKHMLRDGVDIMSLIWYFFALALITIGFRNLLVFFVDKLEWPVIKILNFFFFEASTK